MIYQEFHGLPLSSFGLGAMRLPVVEGDDSRIDEAAAAEMVEQALAQGVNYFDTAWGYHGGHSEEFLGRMLGRHPRDSYYLATKFPGYDLANMPKAAEIFERQLEKCAVDYFDFYLLHNVCEMNIDAYLDPRYSVVEYFLEQQRRGRIRHLGFSAHGSCAVLERFLAVYGEQMEYGQLQLNYVDWTFQEAQQKAALLARYQLPVWVMEPLRGGKLAALSEEALAPLRALRPQESAAGWAMRFLQSLPNIQVVLSGASNMAQLQENIRLFSEPQPLNEREQAALLAVAAEQVQQIVLPCTGCRYCLSHCPQGLNIPYLLELYNEHCFTGGGFLAPMALLALPAQQQPSACIGCRSCEAVCPQQIKISAALADFAARLQA